MSGTEQPPDSAVAVNFIGENFEPSDRLAVVVVNKSAGSVSQRIATAESIMGPDFQSWLHYRNDHDRCEIYISMNALRQKAQGRTKQDVVAIRHIYLDFDADGTAAVERLLRRQDVPKPNYLINSSPGKWQVIWKASGFGIEQAEELQRALARDSGADPAATDISRVLRLPGFHNHKYGKPYLVQVDSLGGETYRPDGFPRISHEDPPDQFRGRPTARLKSRGRLSQSERDWAYAKRALSRGESPALVIAAIANHRRYDKPNPKYYAELTVGKAEEALRSPALCRQEPEHR